MRDRDETLLSPTLRDAVGELRDDAPPSDIWRQRLLHDVAAAPRPSVGTGTRWSVRPITAIAAAVVFMAIGASVTVLATANEKADVTADATTDVKSDAKARVRFTFDAPSATTVALVGDFNGWAAAGLPLRRSDDGRTWVVEVPLAPGRYAYSFVVDGKLAPDPAAPKARDDDFGTTNSVVMVRGGE